MKIQKIRLPISLLKILSGRFFKYQIHSNHKTTSGAIEVCQPGLIKTNKLIVMVL